MRVLMSDEEYRLFSEWISREFGLWFGPERREILRARLEPRRAELGFASFQQLFFHLKFHPEREAERHRLVSYLTNNESYFLRERQQFEIFIKEVLPELSRELRSRGRTELRVLSAGSAAGQEPYSLAILLSEGARSLPLQVRITGVDLDAEVLELARAGRYTAHSFRGVDERLREIHFRQVGEGAWELRPELRRAVEFHTANLADPDWAVALPPQDVVFCRNVLIYFDEAAMQRAARGLHNALEPGGYLFLGHAESLSRVPVPFRVERRPGAIFYRKVDE
jgi:chemotaxis protein methyltransferase CheR